MSNVSSLISPGLLSTLSSTGLPTAFGDQVKETAKKKIISAAVSQIQVLQKKVEDIVLKKIQLEKTHRANLNKLEEQYQPKPPSSPVITKEEYDVAVIIENTRYKLEKEALENDQNNTNNQINSITKDPKNNKVNKEKKQQDKLNRRNTKNKANKTKSAQMLLGSLGKTLAPVLIFSGITLISKLTIQNSKLQELVNKTNDIIEKAQTPEQLNNARASRNSAYNVLTNNEKIFIDLQNKLQILQLIITITRILIPLLYLSPVPPIPLIQEIQKKLDIALLVLSLLVTLLNPVINELNDLKNQLKLIDNKLDLETINLNSLNNLNSLLDTIKQPKDETYKGFKLVIKEDQDPKTFVKNSIKRHYAVAIDKYGVEIIKSEYSYTLEPQILIDQIKLIIDQQNLQA